MRHLKQKELNLRAIELANHIAEKTSFNKRKIYGIPRGGVPAAYLVARYLEYSEVVDKPEDATIFIDDIIDSGKTRDRYMKLNPDAMFYALHKSNNEWVVFPWEGSVESSADDIPTRLLQLIGEDINREGLRDTPKRFIQAWLDYTRGYKQDPENITIFEDGAEKYDQMIVLNDIPVYSHCEHHLAPFFGTASIGYIPDGKIIGLSKLSRIVDIYARRLQVQERLTTQIGDFINIKLHPLAVGVVIKCRHMCMEARGINRTGITTTTSSLHGRMRADADVRNEFLRLVK